MDRQGESAADDRRPEDNWWHDLYEEGKPDTGPQSAGDTLDDRFASVVRTVTAPPGPEEEPPDERDAPAPGAPGAGDGEAGPGSAGEPPVAGERDVWAPGELGAGDGEAVPGPVAEPPAAAEGPMGESGPTGAGGGGTAGPAGEAPPPTDADRPAPRDPGEPPSVAGVPGFIERTDPGEPPAPTPPVRGAGGPPDPRTVALSAAPGGPTGFAEPSPADEAEPVADEPPPPVHRSGTMRLARVTQTETLADRQWGRDGGYVGEGPPTYEAEPTALPEAEPGGLGGLVHDTVLDGARYGAFTLRTVSTRGDSPRYRGAPRRDAVLTARFGGGDEALVFVAVATAARGVPGADRAAAALVQWIGEAVGSSRARLADDIRDGRRGGLKAGLHRLTGRSYGLLRARAAELGADQAQYTAALRCLLLPADPACRTRVFFGSGPGGLFRLRGGEWQDLEPAESTDIGPGGDAGQLADPANDPRPTVALGVETPAPPGEQPADEPTPFAFRATEARPEDVLLLCSAGLAEPLRGEPALAAELAHRWRAGQEPPGLAAFLADVQLRAKGYADDRSAAAVWES